jgi:hypothetical protein
LSVVFGAFFRAAQLVLMWYLQAAYYGEPLNQLLTDSDRIRA